MQLERDMFEKEWRYGCPVLSRRSHKIVNHMAPVSTALVTNGRCNFLNPG